MSVAAKKLTWDDIKDWPESAGRTEIVDGELVMSPTPGAEHQQLAGLLGSELLQFVRTRGLGTFFLHPMHVILDEHVHYEPDLCFIRAARKGIVKKSHIAGPPDLAIEIISESNRTHDTVVKFRDYAKYGVAEYWLVDPRDETISTWTLEAGSYSLLGRSQSEELVVSRALAGLHLAPGPLFDSAREDSSG